MPKKYMTDEELEKLLWGMLKDALMRDIIPTEDDMQCALDEMRARGYENASYLNEL